MDKKGLEGLGSMECSAGMVQTHSKWRLPLSSETKDFSGRPNARVSAARAYHISLRCSRQKPMSISRYIVVAMVRFWRARSVSPVRQ